MNTNVKILITGVNDCSIEIHVIDAKKNEYIAGFLIIDNSKKAVEKIKHLIEAYKTKELIIDYKEVNKKALEKMREEALIE